jgi:uncharacterized membrane protein
MFDPAHLHIMINHAPVIGFVAALVFALCAMFTPDRTMHLVAWGTTLASALAGIATYLTGEPAEESIEELAYSGAYLSAHERWGAWTYYACIGVAVVALVFFIVTVKRSRGSLGQAALLFVLLLVANGLGTITATLGGGVMHREIHGDGFSKAIHGVAMVPAEREMLAEEQSELRLEETEEVEDEDADDEDGGQGRGRGRGGDA